MTSKVLKEIPVVDFYSRPSCHLCEVALTALREIKRVVSIELNEYNIDEDEMLTEKYGLMIPVIQINGKLVQYGNVDFEIVKRILLKEDI